MSDKSDEEREKRKKLQEIITQSLDFITSDRGLIILPLAIIFAICGIIIWVHGG